MNSQFNAIHQKVQETYLIDTHEHFIDESERLNCLKPFIQCDDWTIILGLYTKFDFASSGMSKKVLDSISSPEFSSMEKWRMIEPYWDYIKNTGYGQVIQNTINGLFNIKEINSKAIPEIEEKYQSYRKLGFYRETFERSNVKCCIANPPGRPFKESEMPDILLQDINAYGMIELNIEEYNVGILPEVKNIDDWLTIINWWFDNYSNSASGVKIGNAYSRRLDFNKTELSLASKIFTKKISNNSISYEEIKQLEDFLFWYVVDLATRKGLTVKLHTGHLAMNNFMNLENVMYNPSDCANLCRLSPETRFVFFHIGYPYYEQMISLSKHYSNAFIDMCWAWTLNPISAIDFLKKYIVASPINKLFVFGGDDLFVENLLGHSRLARKGITKALSDLVLDNWISEKDAFIIADRIMHENAEEIYEIAK